MELEANRRILIGFDFPFGYPAGAARQITGEADWQVLWKYFADNLEDDVTSNENNRYALAASANLARFDGLGPYWGCPHQHHYDGLSKTRPGGYGQRYPNSKRYVEALVPKAQEVWKLSGAGSVGGQSITGMSSLGKLLSSERLSNKISVWPFSKNFSQCVCVEIYPSIVGRPPEGVIPDQWQVEQLAMLFSESDSKNELSEYFELKLPDLEYQKVTTEEGWIFGVKWDGSLLGSPSGNQRSVSTVKNTLAYERDPAAIYRASFATVRAEARLERLPEDLHPLAIRLIHACGMVDVASDLAFSNDVMARGREALIHGAPVLCDATMVASGVIRRYLPAGNAVLCLLDDPRVPDLAKSLGTTRSAASVELWRDRIEGAVVAIGNAPTALYHLLERLDDGWPRPAAILGFPVGFVGASESKAELAGNPRGVPFVTLAGRRGGSAIAAAAVNALAAGLPEDAQ
ncbi:precorrin-8X methylmutase [Breoghania sp. L-A4]|uniref:precorrin-8X methylmutase n=1 Tax=Breoghania sp. L-A4 TaxID=2304600 RepID=UPI0020BF4E04|nr:precorrin-8X methylmutase [Breoghania sp. L-A4]